MTASSIRLGYLVCQQTPEDSRRAVLVDEIVAEAQAAESSGFHGVFVSEHHQTRDNFFPSPVVLATALARETTILDIGITVALLPLYHPIRLVEDVTCLDVISNGRVILGLGPGYVERDFDLYGFTQPDAMGRYKEALEIVAHGWDIDWQHEGQRYKATIERITPRPISAPRPRLWLAGGTEAGVRRAALYSDGWVIGGRTPLSRAIELAAAYRAECREVGRIPKIAVIRDAWIADTCEEAFQQVGPGLLAAYGARVAGGFIKNPLLDSLGLEDLSDADLTSFYAIGAEWWIIGDRDTATAQIERWVKEVGISYLIVRFRHATGPSHPVVVEQIARFSSEVLGAMAALR